ncbi:valine--tRNA ligase [Candidatus Berkelbacteria bacterium]|nr:valine--tRNA ligase [Candidatus Berkelbacteria bacterium]
MELPKAFKPTDHEQKIYELWEGSGAFAPSDAKQRFSIIMPPPNVTGALHIGHAVMLTIEDAMIRYHRMNGEATLWLPGTDHAAIATQSIVEKQLWEKEKKTKHDLGRAEFLRRVEQFAKESHDTIITQIKRLGASADWTREAYTLDDERSLAVRTAFKKMYDDDLIYRGNRIVNWDPKLQTTVSDDEVEWKEEPAPLYYLKYGPFTIATARPETKFGDKYVVMHPKDKRYTRYEHNQKIDVQWINGKVTATVIKDEAIDMAFGTGVMTITPWHDVTDFGIAERHKLDKEQIIDLKGKLLPIAGEFADMHIKKARPLIVEKLKQKGLLEKVDNEYVHRIATNSRGGGLIEPQILEQWFMDVSSLKKQMRSVVETGQIKIIPKHFEKTYFHWIDNLRDWCISRQIWFGHQIPVWYKAGETYVGVEPPKNEGWQQDPDTLDTWFSSGLWTFSTLGWPKETEDLKRFHPTDVLETGYDILFFWVARMILMSTYLLGEIPFRTVYLHGLVRDKDRQKMSKTKGNVVDPLGVADIHGADAVRMALVFGTGVGSDVIISEEKIAGMRNFANKVWNIARFILMNRELKTPASPAGRQNSKLKIEPKNKADKDILKKLDATTQSVTKAINEFRFHQAAEDLYHFIWHEFADSYLEASKQKRNDALLLHVLTASLKLLHPFMPFVTETIWQELASRKLVNEPLLMSAQWPTSQVQISKLK